MNIYVIVQEKLDTAYLDVPVVAFVDEADCEAYVEKYKAHRLQGFKIPINVTEEQMKNLLILRGANV